ncbi:cell adhesion molecule L1-like a isoform X2 [Clupea harengus]|uniref:Neural cell adhesion molecule L1 n=1 Tax=Clupea harengus TaxID=7950 RepID=A0A6P8FGX2_CLUHA|nr:cell adhesion molecule L1-like a isoform X2 [Clupea harengus]
MRPLRGSCLALLLALSSTILGLHIPLEVEQLPTITAKAPSSLIAFPFDENFTLKCEAKGNPQPAFRWTRDGQHFDPRRDPRLQTQPNSGSFVIPNNKHVSEYRGKYQCYVFNTLGTAMTEETNFIVPNVPKFPKEKLPPVVVVEGQSIVLECNPPDGIAPLQVYWMTIGLKHIEQNERVSMGLNGNLYFSNAVERDSSGDYCCFAAFPRIRTIVQKPAMSVVVKPSKDVTELDDSKTTEREPSLLLPPGGQSEVHLVKGDELELECIAEGLPTPVYEWTKVGETLPRRTNIKNFGKLLTVAKVKREDDGMFKCTAKNHLGEKSHFFSVSVEEPPSWAEEPPESQLVTIGSDVQIKCATTGRPRPTITWRINGQPIGDTPTPGRRLFDDTIMLQQVQRSDTAVYQCQASNPHGSVMANVNLMVLNLRPLILTRDFQEYSAVQGKHVLMECSVFSSPPATVVWTSGETGETVGGGRFSVLADGSLQLQRVAKEDTGQYTCQASNSEGETFITSKLEIKDPTRIIEPPQDLKILRGTTAQFICQAEYDRSLRREIEILWARDGEEAYLNYTQDARYSVDDGILQISNVSHSDEGLYSCVAKTTLDQDQAAAYLTVLDVPEAPEDLVLADKRGRSVRLKWTPGEEHNSRITEFVVEYEENQWDPERWRELERVPGNHASAMLMLQGHINYRFRVCAVNDVGQGPPSRPTDRYKTQATEPDRNPENIKIEGHLPNQMDITWEPLMPVEHNGPGLEYKVSYRRLGVEDSWTEQMVKRHSFVVKNTPTFVPYEIKIQAHNQQGWGPEPKVVTGYSGEDVPLASPEDVSVEVKNATLLRVRWNPVPANALRGHLVGYNVNWWRTQSLLVSTKGPGEKQSMKVFGNRTHAMIPGVKPFSEYRLSVNVFTKKGNGPSSLPVTFTTPQGVPEKMSILRATNPQRTSITLVWAPPVEANGILTGYSLQYQQINDTQHLGELRSVNVSSPDITQWVLVDLERFSAYKFYLSACTKVGCGPAISEEGGTATEAPDSVPTPEEFTPTPAVTIEINVASTATLDSTVKTLLNVSYYVSDTYVKIIWTVPGEHRNSALYVAYMNHREGLWTTSEAVTASKAFHLIDGLAPGSVYTVRLLASRRHDSAVIFEDVIHTSEKGADRQDVGVSSRGWFVGLMCVLPLATLAALISCFVCRNRGGKYAVKEKEDLPADQESKGVNEDTFCEYSDNDEKPLKGSLHSLERLATGEDDSCESVVDYEDEEEQFNEDGSFIGEYSGRRRRASVEMNGPSSSVA